MQSAGKNFEAQFKKSIPDYCLIHRLKDSAQSFNQSNLTSFAWENPCDFFMFDSIRHILYCLELKSTKYKSMAYENINVDKQDRKMIHKHQILSLNDFSKYDNVVAGFIFNFRDEVHNEERTYFQNIIDFMRMYNEIDKSSCNEMDLLLYGAVKITGVKKRKNYQWDIDKLITSIGGK